MTENHDTQNLEAPPPPPATRFRDRRVGVVALVASTVGALLIGGTLGAVSGAAVGYGVGHHDHPDRPALVQRQDQGPGPGPGQGQGGMPGPQFAPPNGELPPGLTQEDEESSGTQS